MPTFPPATQPHKGPTEQQFQSDLVDILNAMSAKGYTQLAQQFQAFAENFHSQHPQYSAQQVLSAFLGTELGKSLAAGVGGTAAVLGQVPGAAAKGAEGLYKIPVIGALTNVTDFLSRLTSMNTWIRVGEFVLGALLILAGALKLSGQSADLGDIAKLAKVIK